MVILLFALLLTYWEEVGEIMHTPTGKSEQILGALHSQEGPH